MVIAAGFLTSTIKRYRYTRLGIYATVLFLAFLFDLQATSFYDDKLDIVFSLMTLLVLADFFWRGVRLKFMIIRYGSLAAGCALFIWAYSGWMLQGPGGIHCRWEKEEVASNAGANGKYHIKEEVVSEKDTTLAREFVLYRNRLLPFLEQQCHEYRIPEGYEKADFSFDWKNADQTVEVQIIGDNDTLWTLTGWVAPQ